MENVLKILVLGASGMIGHRMWSSLTQFGHDVYGTIRKNELGSLELFSGISKEKCFFDIHAENESSISKVVRDLKPDIIINCIGVVKQLKISENHEHTIRLNALFPHVLARITRENNCRMIHMSTDCVFSGTKGLYTELDTPDACDLYGKSKIMGEVDYLANVLTLRVSTVGREVHPHGGLLEWFLSQEGKKINGFSRAIYSGFPTHTLVKIIDQYVLNNKELFGICHISSDLINKFDLVNLFKTLYSNRIQIERDSSFKIDRSLNCEKFSSLTSFKPPIWSEIIDDLSIDSAIYKKIRCS